jgi:hypothetical protein
VPKYSKTNLPPTRGPRGDINPASDAPDDPFTECDSRSYGPSLLSAAEPWNRGAAEREARKQQEAESEILSRGRLKIADIADELARPIIDQRGHAASKLDPKAREEVIAHLLEDALDGLFGASGDEAIILPKSAEPLKPKTGAWMRDAWGLYGRGRSKEERDAFVADLLEPGYITHAGLAHFVRKHRYAWCPAWGPEPDVGSHGPVADKATQEMKPPQPPKEPPPWYTSRSEHETPRESKKRWRKCLVEFLRQHWEEKLSVGIRIIAEIEFEPGFGEATFPKFVKKIRDAVGAASEIRSETRKAVSLLPTQ